jgi:glycosyltransferase involved in cell wall biosynthesis
VSLFTSGVPRGDGYSSQTEPAGDPAARSHRSLPLTSGKTFAILGSRGYPSYYGGFETLVRYLAPYLAQQGHKVTVYGRRHQQLKAPIATGITVRSTWGIDRKSTSTLTYGLSGSLDLAHQGCDAALVLNVANGFFLKKLKRHGIPTCVNVDGLEWTRDKWGPLGKAVLRRGAALTAEYADELIFDSEALCGFWQDRFGRSEGHFIPYGAPVLHAVGTDRLTAAALPFSGYVLVVARLVPENNLQLLLDAVDLLKPRPDVIVVGGGSYRSTLATQVARLNAAGTIRWLGHVSDQHLLDQLWAHAAVYWHGHSGGGTNPALLQALGAGAPTLAFDTPFNREVLGSAEQLVPREARVVSQRLEEILHSPVLAAALRESGQAIVRARYDWTAVCRAYADLLEAGSMPAGC